MCLIIDANVLSLVLTSDADGDFQPVRNAHFKKKASAVHGGQLTEEYLKLKKLQKLIRKLDRQGILRKVPDRILEEETRTVKKEKTCVSDDPHIIALARVAKIRLLCSHDQNLHADFTNPQIVHPKGSVYQTKSHKHLISKHCSRKK